MSLISEHRKAREDKAKIVLHEFKLRYKKNSVNIYGFVEGKEDPCYYRGFIEHNIPNDWNVELWPAGGKDQVYKIFSAFDWRIYNKNQIIFFIDRDLSEFENETVLNKPNIFITDNYSIENDIVNKSTCDRVLREICGFSELKYEESDKIKIAFDEQLDLFKKALIPVMSNIILWKKKKKKPCLNDIYMKHIFKIKKGFLSEILKPNKKLNLVVYIHEQCNLEISNEDEVVPIIADFETKKHHHKFIRGKYLLWYLVEFCLSIFKDYDKLSFVSISNKPKAVVNLSQSNAVAQVAPRCKMPESLKLFFENTMENYIAFKETS